MKNKQKQKGFIKAILLIIVALVVLKYAFGVNLSDIINNQVVQDAWNIVKQLLGLLWQAIIISINYIKSAIPQMQQFLNSVQTPAAI
ncbi:MAG: hypothetical protein WCV55_02295 [Candidatus Paceibacterota bacterium]